MLLSPIIVILLGSLIAGFFRLNVELTTRIVFIVSIIVAGLLDLIALLLLFKGFKWAYGIHGFLVCRLASLFAIVLLFFSVISTVTIVYFMIIYPATTYGFITRFVPGSLLIELVCLLLIVVGEVVIYRAFISLGIANNSSLLVNGGYIGIASVFAYAFIRLIELLEAASIVLSILAHLLLIMGLSKIISQYKVK